MVRSISRIKKRDGLITDFVQTKITNAVYKAMESNGMADQQSAQKISDIVTYVLEDKFGGYANAREETTSSGAGKGRAILSGRLYEITPQARNLHQTGSYY